MKDVKPGKNTTEFWGKLLIQLALLLNAWFDLGIEIDDETAMTIVGGIEGAYAVARGIAKKKPDTAARLG